MSDPQSWSLTSYYRDEIKRLETGVHAACFAVGAAGHVLDRATTYTDPERLVRLSEVIADLRTALGLSDRTPTDCTGTDAASSTDGDSR